MYFLNGFVTGFLLGVSGCFVNVLPARPGDPHNRLACRIGCHLGATLGFGFLVACFLWLWLCTGIV
jgi:hypothetical protein